MNRPDLLTDAEQKLVDTHRAAVERAKAQRTSAVWGDVQRELENLYHDLDSIQGNNWEETVMDVRRRLYQLLY